MVRKWLVSDVHFGAEMGVVQRKKITAEPILSLDTSSMVSGQHFCSPSSLSSLFGEDSEAVLLDTAQEQGAAVYTHTGMCWHALDIYLFSSPSLSWCSWTLGGFYQLSCQLYYWHFNCFPHVSSSLCFWWPQNHSWTPQASFSNCCHCSWLLQELPAALIFLHWAAEVWAAYNPSFSSFLSSYNSQSGMLLSLHICLFCLPVNSLFCFTHRNWGHGNDIYFSCSDIIRDTIWQGIYRQVLMTVLNQTARLHLTPYSLSWLVHHSQCR